MTKPTAHVIHPVRTDHPDWPGRQVALLRFTPGLISDGGPWPYGLAVMSGTQKSIDIFPSDADGAWVSTTDDEPAGMASLVSIVTFFQSSLPSQLLDALSGHYTVVA